MCLWDSINSQSEAGLNLEGEEFCGKVIIACWNSMTQRNKFCACEGDMDNPFWWEYQWS